MKLLSARRGFLLLLVLFSIIFTFLFLNNCQVHAQEWKVDTEVTEVGRNAARARDLLNWTFSTPVSDFTPIKQAWSLVRNIAIVILIVALLLFGFGIMTRRTETYRVMPYLPVVVLLIVFIYFSYPIATLIIQLFDILQIFILRIQDRTIGGQDLLSVRFNYEDFIGFKRQAFEFQESAEISLFLVRATTFTFMFMVFVLFIRQVFLWLLIIFSPFLSIALSLPFTRNAGKIWIGEFFRWLLYGPFFAIFIKAVVLIWRHGIPFEFGGPPSGGGPYETAISILLGGPGEDVGLGNSVNYVDTYAKYVIALIMLWCAILLPFLLLRIFRDFLIALFKGKESDIKAFFSKIQALRGKEKPAVAPAAPPSPVPPPPPPPPQKFGVYFEKEAKAPAYVTAPAARELVSAETTRMLQQLGVSMFAEKANIAQLARFESDRVVQKQVMAGLNKLSYPQMIASEAERTRYTSLVRELAMRAVKGDEQAMKVLKAAGVDYEKVAKEQGIKVAAIVGRPLGVKAQEVPVEESAQYKLDGIRTEVARVVTLAEGNEEHAVGSLNSVSASISDEFERTVAERVKTEGEENRFKIISEEVGKLVSLASAGDREAIRSLAIVSETLDLGFVEERNVLINNEVAKIASSAVEGEEKSIQAIRDIVATFSFEIERELKNIEAREGLDASVEKTQKELMKVIHSAEIGDTQARDALEAVVTAIGPEFEKKLEEVKKKEVQEAEISLEDYEQVKKMWLNNYRHAEVPADLKVKERKDWVSREIQSLAVTLERIASEDPGVKEEGLKMLSGILPFVLMGDFSEKEIVAYLKAKLEAAKQVLEEILAGKIVEEIPEEELVSVLEEKEEEKEKERLLAAEIEEEESDERQEAENDEAKVIE